MSRDSNPGDCKKSLDLLKKSKEFYPHVFTKTGFMFGLGKTKKEVFDLLRDLREVDCDFLTIGQYLQNPVWTDCQLFDIPLQRNLRNIKR
jgi:lipoate synthase